MSPTLIGFSKFNKNKKQSALNYLLKTMKLEMNRMISKVLSIYSTKTLKNVELILKVIKKIIPKPS